MQSLPVTAIAHNSRDSQIWEEGSENGIRISERGVVRDERDSEEPHLRSDVPFLISLLSPPHLPHWERDATQSREPLKKMLPFSKCFMAVFHGLIA